MIFFGVTTVKNEADIIEAFVRHNLHYLDKLLVLDHGSTDETGSILHSLKKEGLSLDIHHDNSLGKFQGEKMTRLMHQAAAEGADWIFMLDADEFIRCPDGSLPIPSPESPGVLCVGCQTYCVTHLDTPAENNPVLRIQHRLSKEPFADGSLFERKYLIKCVVRGDVARDPKSVIFQGNHEVFIGQDKVESHLWDGCVLGHFSLRSPGQYASKIAIGVMQHLGRGSSQAQIDSFYVKHLEEIKSDFNAFSARFDHLLPAYIENKSITLEKTRDPFPYQGTQLRYTSQVSESTRLIHNLVDYSETLARTLGQFTSGQPTQESFAVNFALFGQDDVLLSQAAASCVPGGAIRHQVTLCLRAWDGTDDLKLRIGGPMGFIELLGIRFRNREHTSAEVKGADLRAMIGDEEYVHPVFHERYFTFIKGFQPAQLTLGPAKVHREGPHQELEVDFRYDLNPATVGLRFMQNNSIESSWRQARLIEQLECKISSLVTLKGFITHQIDWIRSLIFPR